ncbi:MAG: hypothetical protein GY795_48775 [Desulfobacterales bacterium]|nr:hypothetical protein [Desulfobacterales bacterium]
MGTLFNQRERESYSISKSEADNFLRDAVELAKKHKINVSDVIEAYKTLEIERRNNLYHWNGDAFDEQMAGFGELIRDIGESLRSIAENSEQN